MTETSGPISRRRNALLVGAYERDNFGDLLFLLRTREYLSEWDTVASAPFASDMRGQVGSEVSAYARELSTTAFDCVWVVGGEVGGTSMQDAFLMSADPQAHDAYSRGDEQQKSALIRELSGLPPEASPYLPRTARFERAASTLSIINSVGLSELRHLQGERRAEALAALREANVLSVRDRRSSYELSRLGIAHVLAPDLIHTVALSHQPASTPDREVALIQVKAKILTSYGEERFAALLAASAALRPFRLTFFSAGLARGHDSIEQYQRVAEHFARLSPGRSIEISKTTDPWDKVDEIANAGLWIGTSLHGLVISGAYGVPRVGLNLHKLTAYARSWDDPMPYGVNPTELDQAAEFALGASAAAADSGRGERLARLADANMTAAVDAYRRDDIRTRRRVSPWKRAGGAWDSLSWRIDNRRRR